jgi:hypothetical protein
MTGISTTIASIACAPTTPERAYAIDGAGSVFLCANADTNAWTVAGLLGQSGALAIAVRADNADHVFAITGSTVHRSTDAWATWTAIPGVGVTALPAGLSLHEP